MQTVTDLNRRRRRSANLGAGDIDPADAPAEAGIVDEEPDGQKRIEGMERVADVELEKVAWDVHALQEKRMKAGEKEKLRRQDLTDLMVAKGIDSYPLDDEYEAVLKTTRKAYVRKIKQDEEGE